MRTTTGVVVGLLLLGELGGGCGGCGSDDKSPDEGVAPGAIVGRIEASNDVPLATCRVVVEGFPASSDCDESGNFHLRGLAPGAWQLRIMEKSEGLAGRIPARRILGESNPGQVSNTGPIRIAAPGSVGGQVLADGEEEVPFAIIAVPNFGAVTSPGFNNGYLLDRVPVGSHDVVLTTLDGDTLRADVLVEPGNLTPNIDFDLSQLQSTPVTVSGEAFRMGASSDGHGGLTVELIELIDGQTTAAAETEKDGSWATMATSGVYLLRARDGDSPITATIQFLVVHGDTDIHLEQSLVLPPEGGDLDGDGIPDADDPDVDGDGVANASDAFPYDPGESTDTDGDGVGDNSDLKSNGGSGIDFVTDDTDTDGDGVFDGVDDCPGVADPAQLDTDGDGIGDACDNCSAVRNPDQADSDEDDIGDACEICIEGEPCVPANTCHRGQTACSTGTPVCVDTTVTVPNGTPCGTDMVCNGGTCGVCMAGDSCSPSGEPCHQGEIACGSGTAECQDTQVAVANGTVCGPDQVCYAGDCDPCEQDGACTPAVNECKVGALNCTSGSPVCNATTFNVTDGTACGMGGNTFCVGGACTLCNVGDPCQPVDPCHVGEIDCTGGIPSCIDTLAAAQDGTVCGTNLYCSGGNCVDMPDTMTLTAGADQTLPVGSDLAAFTVHLEDGGGQPLFNQELTLILPEGGWTGADVGYTNASGNLSFQARLPQEAGIYTYTVISATAPPIDITATATAATGGGNSAAVNRDAAYGSSGVPGPASNARLANPGGIVVASDGGFYLADASNQRVLHVTLAGYVTLVAGGNGAASSGDGGQATSAQLWNPVGLALDETARILYIAEYSGHRVRAVDLDTGIITTFAGGGSAPAPGYGDDGIATAATLSQPYDVSIGPDNAIYISDANHQRIRRVNLADSKITTFLHGVYSSQGTASCSDPLALSDCGGWGCPLAWSSTGSLFIGGQICGTDPGGNTGGIIRRDSDGSLHHVAGGGLSSAADGVHATDALMNNPFALVLDTGGNLIVSDVGRHLVRRIDAGSGFITTIAGTGGGGAPGPEYADALSSPLYNVTGLALQGDDLLASCWSSNTVRRIGAMDKDTFQSVSMTITAGDNQSLDPNLQTPTPLEVTVTADGLPLDGTKVDYAATQPGIGMLTERDDSDSSGRAAIVAYTGPTEETQTITATLRDIYGNHVTGSPAVFDLLVAHPVAGTIWTLTNALKVSGWANIPGAGNLARHSAPRSCIADDATGDLYFFTDDYKLMKYTPEGEVSVFAGTGAASSNDGPLDSASFWNPMGLAWDVPNNLLYFADYSSAKIRYIDFSNQTVATLAGGGSTGSPTWGNGGLADDAQLSGPLWVAVALNGDVYFGDQRQDQIRWVDVSTGLIDSFMQGVGNCSGETIEFSSCVNGQGCSMAWDGSGGFFLSANICGTDANLPTTGAPGIIHVDSVGTITHVGGYAGGSTTESTQANQYDFGSLNIDQILYDGTDLYVFYPGRVLKIAGATGTGSVTTYAGGGSSSPTGHGDYGPATSAFLNSYTRGCLLPDGRLVIADYGNYSLRIVE